MKLKIKTFGEAVKQIKLLFISLGIEYWYVYLTEVGRYTDWPDVLHSENSQIEPTPGMMYNVQTALIVSDNIELFLLKEDFLFVV